MDSLESREAAGNLGPEVIGAALLNPQAELPSAAASVAPAQPVTFLATQHDHPAPGDAQDIPVVTEPTRDATREAPPEPPAPAAPAPEIPFAHELANPLDVTPFAQGPLEEPFAELSQPAPIVASFDAAPSADHGGGGPPAAAAPPAGGGGGGGGGGGAAAPASLPGDVSAPGAAHATAAAPTLAAPVAADAAKVGVPPSGGGGGQPLAPAPQPPEGGTPTAGYGQLPLGFEVNAGQADPQAQFLAHGQGYQLFLTPDAAAVMVLNNPPASSWGQAASLSGGEGQAGSLSPRPPGGTVVRMDLLGANPAPQASGIDEVPDKSNYFVGSDPSKWRTDIANYGRVFYQNVYDGIDLAYYGSGRQLEYDFTVRPGADPGAIGLSFQGADDLHLDAAGNLVLTTPGGALTEHAPVVYQQDGATRQAVAGRYTLDGGRVGFAVGVYDRSRPLVIDPALDYSTYLGGSSTDQGNGIAVDASGNAYVTGQTQSTNFPTTTGAYQTTASSSGTELFVTKLNSSGSAASYSTYIGGVAVDAAFAIAVDSSGNAYVTGATAATTSGFPVTSGAYQTTGGGGGDAFVTKLSSSGSALGYSTFLGGSGADNAEAIAVDSSGHAYVTGATGSTNFPTASPLQSSNAGGGDAFVTELNATGTALVYSTYLGGGSSDDGRGIAVDASGNAYVTGLTTSSGMTHFPTTSGAYQTSGTGNNAFVAKISTGGSSLSYSTYLGAGSATGQAIAVDGSGDAFVTGYTGMNFPTTSGAFQTALSGSSDAFVTKLNSSGSGLAYSTYLGGSSGEQGRGIALDANGRAYVTGLTGSSNFPLHSAVQGTYGGNGDAFVAVLGSTGGALSYGSYLGGSQGDQGNAIAVDGSGNAYVTGTTSSTNFPTASALHSSNSGNTDAFVTKVDITGSVLSWSGGSPSFTWANADTNHAPTITDPGSLTNAEGDTVSLSIAASDADSDTLTYAAVGLPAGLSINASTGAIAGTVDYSDAESFDGGYTPTVIVADGHGGSDAKTFDWTVTATDRAPTITNPGSQSSNWNDTVSEQISASDPDGDQLFYDDAGTLPPGLSIDPGSGLISGTVDPSAVVGTPYSVTVTADDGTLSASATFNWTIGVANHAPTLDTIATQTNAAGDAVTLSLSSADADNDPLTFTASGLPDGLSIDPATGDIVGTLASSAAGTTAHSVTVRVSDGMASASQTFNWTVNQVGVANPGDQDNVNGDTLSLPMTASDSTSGTLSYSATGLPSGLSIDSGTGEISGTIANTADASSPYTTTVTATDGTYSGSTTFNWTVEHLALTAPADRSDREGASVSFSLSATDADSDTLSYSATGLPAGVSINSSTGAISGTVGVAAHGSSPYQVTVTASDGTHSASQSFVWTVTPRVALVNPGAVADATGDTVSLQVQATALAGGTLSYSATGLPSGLSISSSTGLISGTVGSGAAQSTPYSVTVTASDGTSSSSQTFPWSVSVVLLLPPGDQANLTSDSVSLTPTSSYHGSGTLSWSATGLPTGLSLNSGTGAITGTVSTSADTDVPYDVTVTVGDGTHSASQEFNWTISPRISVDAPGDQANAAGDTVDVIVSGNDAASGTPAWSATGLPSGLSIDSGTGEITGTVGVGADASSPYSVTVTAGDGTESDSTTFAWTVTHLSLVDPGPQTAGDGTTVSLTIQGGDADGGMVGYTASGLPSGLSINATTGVISGTVGTSAHTSSPYLVTVTVSDGTHSQSDQFVWTVSQVGLTNPGDQTNVEGDTVSLTLVGSTPSGTGTLSYSAFGLPDGLSVDASTGVISGTLPAGAAADGPYTVTVAATNGTLSTSQTFTWTVNPQVSVTTPADQANVEGDTVSLAISAADAGSLTLTYSADELPDGLSINSGTGVISGTVATGASADGPYVTTVTASDGTYSTSVSFNWAITHGSNTAPVLTNPGDQANVAGDTVDMALTASDADGDFLTFSATGLPDGLTIDPYTGDLSGTVASDATNVTAPYAVTVVVDDGNGGTASQTFSWQVSDTALPITAGAVSATEGTTAYADTLATFTDANLDRQATDYAVTINWGDGSTAEDGNVSGQLGSFTVAGAHVYAHPGTYSVVTSVTDPVGTTVSVTSTATVAAASITGTGGLTVYAAQGVATTQTLATFQDIDENETASSYTATVSWGDGSSTSVGSVTGGGGAFTVTASHTYAAKGTYTAAVTVTDADGTSATTTSTFVVGDVFAGISASMTLGTFTTTTTGATAGSFTATITWGDSATGTGTVSGSSGAFTVTGNHVYTQDGTYPATVTLMDGNGNSLTANYTLKAVPAPIVAYAANLASYAGATMTNSPVAVLVDENRFDTASQFSGTVDPGDGTTPSTGTFAGSAGLYQLLLTHTFSSAGLLHPRISGLENGLEDFVLLSTAFVAASPVEGGRSLITRAGPSVIPGLSQYEFKIHIPDVPRGSVVFGKWEVTAGGNAIENYEKRGWYYYDEDPKTGNPLVTDFSTVVTFQNEPALVTPRYTGATVAGLQLPDRVFNVSVVKVALQNTKIDYEKEGTAKLKERKSKAIFQADDKVQLSVRHDLVEGAKDNSGFTFYQNQMRKGKEPELAAEIQSNGNGSPAFKLLPMKVILTPPVGANLRRLQIGLIQIWSPLDGSAVYKEGKTEVGKRIVAPAASLSVDWLESARRRQDSDRWPWYNAPKTPTGPMDTQQTLGMSDSPADVFPREWNPVPMANPPKHGTAPIARAQVDEAATLRVAVSTLDTGAGADLRYFDMAHMIWTTSFIWRVKRESVVEVLSKQWEAPKAPFAIPVNRISSIQAAAFPYTTWDPKAANP